jgi:DNA-binding MarR family transcriptional regulator
MANQADKPHELSRAEPDRRPRSVGFLISQLGFLSSKGFMVALEPLGIHPREFLLLRLVAAAEGHSQQALAERMGVPPSRMVALVDRLEENGLLERRPHPDDRRIRALHMTAEGRDVLARAGKIAVRFESELCSSLEEDERDQLIDLLQKLQVDQSDRRGVHHGLVDDDPERSPEVS